MVDGPDASRKVTARFRVELPPDSWIRTVSRSFPASTFRLLAGLPTDRGAMHLGEVRSDTPDAVSEAVRAHPSVLDYERLHATADRTLARYETTETGLYDFLERAAVVPDYPVVVRDGWFQVDLTDTRDRVESFGAGLEASTRPYELVALVETVDEDALLTARQREALDVALQAGYFEVPRECRLADVAEALDVDPSTASGVIRRAEAKLVTSALAGPRTPD